MRLFFWLFAAPLLFTSVALALMFPSALIRAFVRPESSPLLVDIFVGVNGLFAYVASGALVWWAWKRIRSRT